MIRVYIAGPYTQPDPAVNVRAAMDVWHVLANAGLAPYCPHLTHFLHLHQPQDYEFWMAQDFEWLRACQLLIRLPGESRGADREVELAREAGTAVILWDWEMRNWPSDELRAFLQGVVEQGRIII